MVLAAGLGSRLRPLTTATPKPLVPVGDRPVLAHVLDHLALGGVARIVVNAHYGAEALTAFVAGRAGCTVSHESELLGTAGGVARAAVALGRGPVLVWNADILAGIDIASLVAAHAASRPREAKLVVQPRERGQGSVGLDHDGWVVRLRGERARGAASAEASGGEFVGVHVLGEGLRGTLPGRGCLVGDVYIPALMRGARLASFRWNAPFYDIGSIEAYQAANLAWLVRRGLVSWTGLGATVAPGVTLAGSVVGDGATVVGRGSLERCVVWPGAAAEAPLEDTVVIPGASCGLRMLKQARPHEPRR